MSDFRQQFLSFALERNVLRFGEFTLKSGRVSPYFFNAGLFNRGRDLAELGRFYSDAVVASGIEFDLVFGPAYKGIPLATLTAAALAERHNIDKPYCFNRKETKDHGEGGQTVGAPLAGRVLIVDDVITAGTAIRESVNLIRAHGAEPVGVVIALDRQEKGSGELSAVQQVEQELGLQVASIARLNDLIGWLEQSGEHADVLPAVRRYRADFGVA